MKRNLINISILIIIILLFTSCAQVIDIDKSVPIDAKLYGFWNGLWHGLISWFSLIGKLFNFNVAVYAVNNNGGWYDFGFILGAGSTLSSGCTGARKSKKVIINKYYS